MLFGTVDFSHWPDFLPVRLSDRVLRERNAGSVWEFFAAPVVSFVMLLMPEFWRR